MLSWRSSQVVAAGSSSAVSTRLNARYSFISSVLADASSRQGQGHPPPSPRPAVATRETSSGCRWCVQPVIQFENRRTNRSGAIAHSFELENHSSQILTYMLAENYNYPGNRYDCSLLGVGVCTLAHAGVECFLRK